MEITRHTTTELVLQSGQNDLQRLAESRAQARRLSRWLGPGLVLGVALCLLALVTPGFWRGLFALALLTLIGLFVSTLLVFLVTAFVGPVTTCRLDKTTSSLTLVSESLWPWRSTRLEQYALHDIQAVTLLKNEDAQVMFGLRRIANSAAPTTPVPASTSLILLTSSNSLESLPADQHSIVSTAEQVSQFLTSPLEIDLGTEIVVKYPVTTADVTVRPLSCPRCGGQLTSVQPGFTHVTCPYCGTTILIQ